MKAKVYTLQGESPDTVELPESVFGVAVNESLMAQAVRVYLANQRQGNANTKGRGDVTGSTRKVYKQKGTGNARHGDIKAPIFVGGGVVHGPVTHSFTMSFPVKMRRAALRSALSARAENVALMDGFTKAEGKTKAIVSALDGAAVEGSKVLVVLGDDMDSAKRALRNNGEYDFMYVKDLNTYEVLNHESLIIAKEAIAVLETWLGAK
jgi:large subunit ribosomal protein L4